MNVCMYIHNTYISYIRVYHDKCLFSKFFRHKNKFNLYLTLLYPLQDLLYKMQDFLNI